VVEKKTLKAFLVHECNTHAMREKPGKFLVKVSHTLGPLPSSFAAPSY
jgi:hypothetical protein